MTTSAVTISPKSPKYIERANLVLETIVAQPGQTWRRTQRELGLMLNIPQPELSVTLKLLEDKRRIIRGTPLKTRGRNHELVAISTEPLTRDVEATKFISMPVAPVTPPVSGVIDLSNISQDQITVALKKLLQQAWENEAELKRLRDERKEFKYQCQRRVADIRKDYERIEARKRELESTVDNLRNENSNMRGRLNSLILKTVRGDDGSTYTVNELLREEDRRELKEFERMMRQRPNDYRGRAEDDVA